MAGPKLSVLAGSGAERVFIGAIEVAAAPLDAPPFFVDAVVEEEDTHLVLSAPPVVPELADHPIRIMTDLWNDEPEPLGRVLVRPGRPSRLLAVVHDLDLEPSVTPATVALALDAAFAALDALGARAVRLPLLGAVHGVLPPSLSASLVGRALRAASPRALERVWLITTTPESTLGGL